MLGRRRLNASHCASARSPLFPRRIASFERLVVRLKDDSLHWLIFRKAVIRDLHDKEATTHGIGTTRIYPIGGPPSTPQPPANLSAASAPTPLMATLFRLLAESNLAARLALLWTRTVSKANNNSTCSTCRTRSTPSR